MRRMFGNGLSAASASLMALMVWVMLTAPSVSQACAVCTAGRDDENALAFLLSTIFMSAMPLVALGTVLFVIWRRVQKLDAEQEARQPVRRDAPPRASV